MHMRDRLISDLGQREEMNPMARRFVTMPEVKREGGAPEEIELFQNPTPLDHLANEIAICGDECKEPRMALYYRVLDSDGHGTTSDAEPRPRQSPKATPAIESDGVH
jgi:hypothetical protein